MSASQPERPSDPLDPLDPRGRGRFPLDLPRDPSSTDDARNGLSAEESFEADSFDVELPPYPYPGLRPFERDEWPIFFGRERMTDEVVERLIRQQFLVVHGDSGCGKSSLLRAGVLARLEQESARGGLTWRTCVTQPRDAPLQRLAASLAALDRRAADDARLLEIRRALNFGADAPPALARLLRRGKGDHVCVLIDQFEELFAFARRGGVDEARLFAQILVALLEQPPAGLYVVVAMRSEFLGACAQYRGLAEAVNRAQYLLPRMEHQDLVRAIREPAALYGGSVSRELAERLIRDASGGQDQLPLIQHGLMLMYRRAVAALGSAVGDPADPVDRVDPATHLAAADVADAEPALDTASIAPYAAPDVVPTLAPVGGWRLGLANYDRHVAELLSTHADEVTAHVAPGAWSHGAPDHSMLPVIEHLFRALTDINADGQAIRRPQTFARLLKVTGTDDDFLRRTLDAFRSEGVSFITPFRHEPIHPGTLVDISHEALIRCWRRIADPKEGWLAREFQDGLVWRSLLVQAESFEHHASSILSPATAEERQPWLEQHTAAWAERYGGGWERVSRLVTASLEAARAAQRAARRRVRRQILAALLVGLVIAGVMAIAQFRMAQARLEGASRVTATSLWNRFDQIRLDGSDRRRVASDELKALWELRRAHPMVTQAFIDELQRDAARAVRLVPRAAPVLRAIALDWRPERTSAIRDVLIENMRQAAAPEHVAALGSSAAALPGPLTDDQVQKLFAAIVAKLSEVGSARGRGLGTTLSTVADRLTPNQAVAALPQVLELMNAATDEPMLGMLASAVSVLARRIPTEWSPWALPLVLDALSETTEASARSSLAAAGRTLVLHMNADQAPGALALLLPRVKATGGPTIDQPLSMVGALAPQLTPEQASQAFDATLEAVDRPDVDGNVKDVTLRIAGATLKALAARLDATQRRARLAPLVDRLPGAKARLNAALAPAVEVLATSVSLSDADAPRMLTAVLSGMEKTTDLEALRALSTTAADLACNLAPERARPVRAALRTAVAATDTRHPARVAAYATVVMSLHDTPVAADNAAMLPVILKAMVETKTRAHLQKLSAAVPGLAVGLTSAQVRLALAPVLEQLEKTDDGGQFVILGSAVRDVAGRLSAADARPLLTAMQHAMIRTTEHDERDMFSGALRAVAARLPAAQIQQALTTQIAEHDPLTDVDELRAAATIVRVLGDLLPPEQVHAAVTVALDGLAAPAAKEKYEEAARLAAVSAPLVRTVEERRLLAAHVARKLPKATEPQEIWALASAVPVVVAELPADQLVKLRAAILRIGDDLAASSDPKPAVPFDTLGAAMLALLRRASGDERAAVFARTPPFPVPSTAPSVPSTPTASSSLRRPSSLAATLRNAPRASPAPATPTASSDAWLVEQAGIARALAGELTPPQAAIVLDGLLIGIGRKPVSAEAIDKIAPVICDLIGRVEPAQSVTATYMLRTALGWSQDAATAAAIARLMGQVLVLDRTVPEAHFLIEALKYPTTTGPATPVLLDALRAAVPEAPGSQAGLEANLAWFKGTYPRTDLDAPPACPIPHRLDMACPSAQP